MQLDFRINKLTYFAVIILVSASALAAGNGPRFVTFDPPGSTSTAPSGINGAGTISGLYKDVNAAGCYHGFIRTAAGLYTSIDVPGASTSCEIGGTYPTSINLEGAITGYWIGPKAAFHGFVRSACAATNGETLGATGDPACTITSFDTTNSGTSATFPFSINAEGAITGLSGSTCTNPILMNCHGSMGFLRTADGVITTFDVPDASGNTWPVSLNEEAAITGTWYDSAMLLYRGFSRDANGAFTVFDAPVATQQNGGISPTGINAEGVITGFYEDASGVVHGFVRGTDGMVTGFDPPGSLFTYAAAIDRSGTVTGYYEDANQSLLSFLRSPSGAITSFEAPGAGTSQTSAASLNVFGAVTGYYDDASGKAHGFLRTAP